MNFNYSGISFLLQSHTTLPNPINRRVTVALRKLVKTKIYLFKCLEYSKWISTLNLADLFYI